MTPLTLTEILRSQPDVELAMLFGSMASGRTHAGSDIDVAVLCTSPLTAQRKMALIAELAQATGRPIDLIDLRTAGEPLLGQILQHGKRLFGSDEALGIVVEHLYATALERMPTAGLVWLMAAVIGQGQSMAEENEGFV